MRSETPSVRKTVCSLVWASFWLCLVFAADACGDPPVDYLTQVRPIFDVHCVECHSGTEAESGLRVDVGKGLLEGGNSGPAIVPGHSGRSLLIQKVDSKDASERMPPESKGTALSKEDVALLRDWIDQGAPLPVDPKATVDESRRFDHWSLQPVVRPEVPAADGSGSFPIRNPIDAFIFRELDRKGLRPSREADRTTLVRRVSLDLVGLPPTQQEMDAFLNDKRPDAYEVLVERLLASPHFGERWGRLWLDLARYADSDGYTFDNSRVIWPYRDWVIRALNDDLPYDQFVIAQIAGDMLPQATESDRVATGFHRNTQLNQEGGIDREEFRLEAIIDRVSTTGEVFLGLTLGCARCHDHKFDPISQREFFELLAFFNNADEPKLTLSAPASEKESATTLVMQERAKPRETRIMIRGEYPPRGRVVHPAVPAVLSNHLPLKADRPNRLDLARWLVCKDNPITSRVTVNRIWQSYFGRGLVETSSDFGTQGTPPSHPELLDWLASEFMRCDWRMKDVHRLILNSSTYRQSSSPRSELIEVDPDNRLLARQNRLRLDAEIVRDSVLSASGLLCEKIGGPSVFPPQPPSSVSVTQKAKPWQVSKGEDRYRRGMYTFLWRSSPYPGLRIFDAPDASLSCTRRDRSNTPLQALVLLNDEAQFEAAEALALQLCTLGNDSDATRVQIAFEKCLSRTPSDDELDALLSLLTAERQDPSAVNELWKLPVLEQKPHDVLLPELTAWTMVARALMNCDEFITRQ